MKHSRFITAETMQPVNGIVSDCADEILAKFDRNVNSAFPRFRSCSKVGRKLDADITYHHILHLRFGKTEEAQLILAQEVEVLKIQVAALTMEITAHKDAQQWATAAIRNTNVRRYNRRSFERGGEIKPLVQEFTETSWEELPLLYGAGERPPQSDVMERSPIELGNEFPQPFPTSRLELECLSDVDLNNLAVMIGDDFDIAESDTLEKRILKFKAYIS